MAHVKDNILLKNVSGTIGRQMNIFNRYGETYLRTAKKKKQLHFSAIQLESQHNFADAVVYSKQVIKDPEMNLYYLSLARKGQSAYNVAMKDALSAPVIRDIDADTYTGESGQVISIYAVDHFRVYQVHVAIINAAGDTIEKGLAVQQWKPMYWDYTTTMPTEIAQVEKIQVIAVDMPGNQTKAVLTFTDG
ncbi:hypothetical protein [Chitinophaga pinensis]|uniref:Uncharacterized protein n=1 Tax=Chitinophaga pinensis (strain ATCC 43595 / DSM 2588 / LMG 13176 / NBRC 15968 / NCIMB 11800 / UQM 2034) TaxID=485918 RepID=A0A979GZR4_CHIPD|nr:hypothetical protein [Chitinophaga pinensis]ACU62765.1 hypothetical protein Cpin_5334 [Chitinophaga pinensis DSM 2588]